MKKKENCLITFIKHLVSMVIPQPFKANEHNNTLTYKKITNKLTVDNQKQDVERK